MRGGDLRSGNLFSYIDLEARVPAQHPLRAIGEIVNRSLAELSGEFQALYSHTGRPSIAPEKLLRALLLQAFYSIRSERRLMSELEFNLLYRWFVGLGIDDPARFLARLLAHPKVKRLLSAEHFSVDGTLIEAWASIKSFRPMADDNGPGDNPGDDAPPSAPAETAPAETAPEGRNAERDFHGERWSNQTHRSSTDGDARLYRKGRNKEARLGYLGHALMENRHGLVVDGLVSRATGEAERLAAEAMLLLRPERRRPITLGADKGYDAAELVAACKAVGATPHIARNQSGRRSNIDDATAASHGYAASQRVPKRIEEVFAWVKTIAGWRKTHHRGLARVSWQFTLALAAYNLIRLPKLLETA